MGNWDVSGVKEAPFAFANMSALENVVLIGWNFTSLENAYGLFANNFSLRGVDLSTCAAPNLVDAGGMFYNNISATRLLVPNLIGPVTTNISYFASGCTNLLDFNISAWDTSGVKFMQGFLDGADSLVEFTIGPNFSTEQALSVAVAFRNASRLSDATLQAFIAKFNPTNMQDGYEMLKGCVNVADIDFSGKDFTAATNLTRMLYGATNATVITLPASFGVSITDIENNGKNIFYVPDETLTFLTIKHASIPTFLANYSWNADNRAFMIHNDSTINGESKNTFKFTSVGANTAELKLLAETTFYLDNVVPASISYKWTNGSSPLSTQTNTHQVTNNGAGSFTCTAYLSDVTNAGSVSDTFTISKDADITGISAVYKGPSIVLNENYNIDDVEVVVSYDDRTTKKLNSTDFTVSGQKVAQKGNNTFTAYYTSPSGSNYSASFMVTGRRVIGSIEVTYTGPDVKKGTDYKASYITSIAYYRDDITKTEGFAVSPTSYSSKTVTSIGANTFTAYYIDSSNGNNTLSDTFTVSGYAPNNISSIVAVYTGPDIVVGQTYDRNNVIVTLHFNDGTTSKTTKDFTLNSIKVSNKGANIFEATYTDDNGRTLSATFTVKGIEKSVPTTTNAPTNNIGVQTGDTLNLTGIAVMILGLILLISMLIVLKTTKHPASNR